MCTFILKSINLIFKLALTRFNSKFKAICYERQKYFNIFALNKNKHLIKQSTLENFLQKLMYIGNTENYIVLIVLYIFIIIVNNDNFKMDFTVECFKKKPNAFIFV
jgi:hypothetical protein